ncbi:Fam177 family [Globisporangium polare]
MHDLELSANQHDDAHEEAMTPLKPQQQLQKHEPGSPEESGPASSYTQTAWQWACWSGEKTWDGLDFAGEVVANFLGLTTSKYQWMIDMQEREDEDRRQRKLEARQRRQLRLEQLLEQEKRKLQELEAGGENGALDDESREDNQSASGDDDEDLELFPGSSC